jgi:hypothetical protein
MQKAEIIEAAMRQASEFSGKATEWTGPLLSYEEFFIADLKRKLSHVDDDAEVLTCVDLRQLGVECCSVCHYEYPDELKLIRLQAGGGYAWICCAVERAILNVHPISIDSD